MEIDTSTATFLTNTWNIPERMEVCEYPDRIELIYKQTSVITNGLGYTEERTFKIVFSCVDGKWHRSEPIFGEIIPAQPEHYSFD